MKEAARDEFAKIINAITDYSGEMSCEIWEKTYPEFVGMTEDDLYRQLTLRKAKLLLGRKSRSRGPSVERTKQNG